MLQAHYLYFRTRPWHIKGAHVHLPVAWLLHRLTHVCWAALLWRQVLPEDLNRLLIIVVVLSMALTPALAEFGKRFAERTANMPLPGSAEDSGTPWSAEQAYHCPARPKNSKGSICKRLQAMLAMSVCR